MAKWVVKYLIKQKTRVTDDRHRDFFMSSCLKSHYFLVYTLILFVIEIKIFYRSEEDIHMDRTAIYISAIIHSIFLFSYQKKIYFMN